MLRTAEIRRWIVIGLGAAVLMVGGAREASAHCDTMSGPVVNAAQDALASGNVNLVLIWVQPGDETAIRDEFTRALTARAEGGEAREAADLRFFEALVRIHRAGEGAPYTGIQPADTDVGPAVAAADQALAAGSVDPVRTVLTNAVQSGIEGHFREVMDRSSFSPDDVAAGRAYVRAYVEYTHYAEGVYDRATAETGHHEHTAQAQGLSHEGHGTPSAEAEHSEHTAQAQGLSYEGHGTPSVGAHEGQFGHVSHLPWILTIVLGIGLVVETGWIVRSRRRG